MAYLTYTDGLLIARLLVAVLVFMLPVVTRRSHFAVRAVAGIIILAGAVCLFGWLKYFISENYEETFAIDTLLVAFYYVEVLVVFGVCMLCFSGRLNMFIFVFIAGTTLQNMMYLTSVVIVELIPVDMGYYALFIELAVVIAYLAGAYFALVRRTKNDTEYFDKNLGTAFYIVLFIALSVINNFLISLFDNFTDSAYIHYMTFVVLIILDIIYFVVQFGFFWLSKVHSDRDMLQAMLGEKEKQYEMSRQNIELINIKSHDLKRQLEALRLASDAERTESMEEMSRVINDYDSTVNTESQALNVLLTEKSRTCEVKGIAFSCIADGSKASFINSVDLYSMLGNALDNAIESSEKLPEDKRSVSVSITEKSGMLSVQVMNYFDPAGLKKDKEGSLATTKADSRYHGFGSKSIKSIAAKYGGTAVFSSHDDIFTLQIIIPISAE